MKARDYLSKTAVHETMVKVSCFCIDAINVPGCGVVKNDVRYCTFRIPVCIICRLVVTCLANIVTSWPEHRDAVQKKYF